MDEMERKIELLIQEMVSFSEKKMRASSLKKKFQGKALTEITAILNQICLRANKRELSAMKAYSALPELIDSLCFSRDEISELRRIARKNNYAEVLQLFLDLPPKPHPADPPESLQDISLKDVTLGHRKSLAKTQNMTLLRKLLREQDPAVIHYLLMNPRLTESEVLRIASLKPTSPKVLEEVFLNPKWSSRYRVKKALVSNPYCPPAISVHLLKFMLVSDLREIAENENLHLITQETAHRLLQEKEAFSFSEPPEPQPNPEPQ